MFAVLFPLTLALSLEERESRCHRDEIIIAYWSKLPALGSGSQSIEFLNHLSPHLVQFAERQNYVAFKAISELT